MAVFLQLLSTVCVYFVVNSVRSEELDHRFFLSQLIDKYGDNGTISYEGFEQLYQNLGLGYSSLESSRRNKSVNSSETLSRGSRHIHTDDSSNGEECNAEEELAQVMELHSEVTVLPSPFGLPSPPHCLSARQLLAVYGVQWSNSSLSPVTFLHLCPAIIYELDQRTCSEQDTHHHTEVLSEHNWLYAVGTVVFISFTGLGCVILVPLLQKSFFSHLISFLVSLAVGTLLGDAFLHLIPHALASEDKGHHHTDSVFKTGVIFLTIVAFFTFEAVLNINQLKKKKEKCQENVHYLSVNNPNSQKEMMEMTKIQEHGHSHSPSNTALMVIIGDGLHNLTDGLAIGAAFAGGTATGFATGFAVFTHELPHELGDFAVLLQSGISVPKALLYNVLSSVLSLLGTVVGLAVGNFGDATRWIYAITAGSFIYIALANLVPEINRTQYDWKGLLYRLFGFLLGGAFMGAIALFEHNIQDLFH